jgi:hypothetical protein
MGAAGMDDRGIWEGVGGRQGIYGDLFLTYKASHLVWYGARTAHQEHPTLAVSVP